MLVPKRLLQLIFKLDLLYGIPIELDFAGFWARFTPMSFEVLSAIVLKRGDQLMVDVTSCDLGLFGLCLREAQGLRFLYFEEKGGRIFFKKNCFELTILVFFSFILLLAPQFEAYRLGACPFSGIVKVGLQWVPLFLIIK